MYLWYFLATIKMKPGFFGTIAVLLARNVALRLHSVPMQPHDRLMTPVLFNLAIFVTAIQNIQMLLGVGVTVYFYANRLHCNIPTHYWIITMSMYLFYVYLFGNL